MSSTSHPHFASAEVDLVAHPTAMRLLEYCLPLLHEFLDYTPGDELQSHLNKTYHPDSSFYTGLRDLVLTGLSEGWFASVELDGKRYRRGRLCVPCEETWYFSITAVYLDSGYRPATSTQVEEGRREDVLRTEEYHGFYHVHPYGEINAVIPLDKTAEIKGMAEWQSAGWTSPGPGTKHFPEVRGGRAVALFFLPAGRIAYPAEPSLVENEVPQAKEKTTLRDMMGLTDMPRYQPKAGAN